MKMVISVNDISAAMDTNIILASQSIAKDQYSKRLSFNPYSLSYLVKVRLKNETVFNETYKHPQDAVDAFNDK